jgi:hypothetical protein
MFNAVSAGPMIRGIQLAAGAGSGPDFDVNETIFTTGDFLSVNELNLTDSVLFQTPQASITFDKDISLNADGQIDYVTQQLAVPEPSGLSVLLLAGAMGLRFRRRGNRTSGAGAKSAAN